MSLSSIVNYPYVDSMSSASSLACGAMKSLASMVKTKAMGVVHIDKFNPNSVSKTLCWNISVLAKSSLETSLECSFVCGNALKCATMHNMQITSPLET